MGSGIKFDEIEADLGTCFSIHVVVSFCLYEFASFTQMDSMSNFANFLNSFCSVLYSMLIASNFSKSVSHIQFLHSVFQMSHISLYTHKFRSLHNSIIFVSVKVSTHSILKIFQNDSKCKVNFCSTFQFLEYIIQLIVERRHVEGSHGKVEDSVSSVIHFSICQIVFARFQFFPQNLIVNISYFILHISSARFESHLGSMLSVSVVT